MAMRDFGALSFWSQLHAALPCDRKVLHYSILRGVIERGLPQASVRACASTATLCSEHVLRVFLCIFFVKEGIRYVSKRAWIHIWCTSKPVPPCRGTPLMIILNVLINFGIALHSFHRKRFWAEIILLYIILTTTLMLKLLVVYTTLH